jgi:hypothetical protein
MNIQNALKKEPQHIQDSPVVHAMVQLIQNQAEQIQNQAEQIITLKKIIEDLKDEISRLNKTPKRPKFKLNKMEPRNRSKGGSSEKTSSSNKNICAPDKKLEVVTVKAKGVPQGSRFKGYAEFKVQDLEIIVREITYKLEVWQSLDGTIIRAQLPEELKGKHFGAYLRTLIINLYAQGMTQPTIYDFLQGIGIEISSGQINHILLEEADGFAKASEAILQAGLSEASYIYVQMTQVPDINTKIATAHILVVSILHITRQHLANQG